MLPLTLSQQPSVNRGTPSSFCELSFPKTWETNILHPQKDPAEDLLSASTEEVQSATGAAEPVLYRSHHIRPVHIHQVLVQSNQKTGQDHTAANSEDRRKTHWCSPARPPELFLFTNQGTGRIDLTDSPPPGHNLFQLLPSGRRYRTLYTQNYQTQEQSLHPCHHK